MIIVIICSSIFLSVAFLTVQYSLLIPPVKGIPVLMYHKVSENLSDGLTIKRNDLYLQLLYLKQNGYTTIFCKDLIDNYKGIKPLPKKAVLVTFDDAYQNNFELLTPILSELQIKATIFIPVKYIGGVNTWDKGQEPIMNDKTLKSLNPELVELGLHSFAHDNYSNITLENIEADIQKCFSELDTMGIHYTKVLAYPYGKYPRKEPEKSKFKALLKKHEIDFGFRIGNKINKLPIKYPYELKRIDIKGTDSFWTFKTKLKKGRVKLF
jgi:peptidoglycan/xylan/chitin deacetylase (PgdA/CDA1 family)